jgi:hypothetical protein
MELREKPHTDKYKGITNDSNYVASCTPTSSVSHLRLIFVAQSVPVVFSCEYGDEPSASGHGISLICKICCKI